MKLRGRIAVLMLAIAVVFGGVACSYLANEKFGLYQFLGVLDGVVEKHNMFISQKSALDIDMGAVTFREHITTLAHRISDKWRKSVRFEKGYKTGLRISDGTNSMLITMWGHDDEVFGIDSEVIGDERSKRIFSVILSEAKQEAQRETLGLRVNSVRPEN
ncbi:MAG: hypothetical protein WCO77_12970 [bacterium]